MWDTDRRIRLAAEEKLMASKLPQFNFHDRSGNTYIEGWEYEPDFHYEYGIRMPIPPSFPYEEPELLVISPVPLYRFGGEEVISGSSHAFHTHGCNDQGQLRICHCPPGAWDAAKTCFSVVIKGLLWVHAYERHLSTGMTIEAAYQEYERRIRE